MLWFNFAHGTNRLVLVQLFLNWYKIIDPVQNLLNWSHYIFFSVFDPCTVSKFHFSGFNKILSRWQKLWSKWRTKKLVARVQLVSFWKNFEIWASNNAVPAFWSKIRVFVRTQTSLNFGSFIQWQHMNTLFKLG